MAYTHRQVDPSKEIVLAWFHAVAPISEPGDYEALIDWGDGRREAGRVEVRGTRVQVYGTPGYAQAAMYDVTITLRAGGKETSNTTLVRSAGMVPPDRTLDNRQIVPIQWEGETVQAVAGEWIVSLFTLPGWKPDSSDASDWAVVAPQLKQALDQTGLQYTFNQFLVTPTVFSIQVDPEITHAQLHQALSSVLETIRLEPNILYYGTVEEAEPVHLDPKTPVHESTPGKQHPTYTHQSSFPLLSAHAGIADLIFTTSDLFESEDEVLG